MQRHTQLEHDFPEDVGILPDTFIMPRSSLPSIFTTDRWRLEFERLKAKAKDFVSIVVYRYGRKKPKHIPPSKIHFFKTGGVAKDLYEKMYTSYAKGDTQALNDVCVDGLAGRMSNSISSRGSAIKVRWELVRFIGRPKVVAHRATQVPHITGAGIRQAVVRVKSEQRIEEWRETKKGRETIKPDQTKTVTEYVVLQKWSKKFVDDNWKIWGMTKETDWEAFKKTL